MNVNLKSLMGKLNDTCRTALQNAAGLSLSRNHYEVEVEHLLFKLNEASDTDVQQIFRHYDVDTGRLSADLNRVLDRLKTGSSRTPLLSPHIAKLVGDAWTLASIEYEVGAIRSGHLLAALLSSEDLASLARDSSSELSRISPEDLIRNLSDLTSGSGEDKAAPPVAAGARAPAAGSGSSASGKTPALDQFTFDLTARARQGEIDPVIGREFEVRQVVDILTRRRQNNPILTGEAGVGKTAVVEGLALRIASGDVPPPLRNVSLRTLDLALLQAGAGVRGEFENRLKSVISEVKASPQPIILFIDEAHTLIGAGGSAGQGDAANLLKPALARGELRTVAATTWSEYKKYFEKDPALTRRFQVVKVEEPDEPTATSMMRGIVDMLERHHKVRILDEAVDAAVRLSHRYISDRQLPDKSVSVLDTACARVALGQMATPAAIEDCQRRLSLIDTETAILERESLTGTDCRERREDLARERSEVEARLQTLQAQWERERQLVADITSLRERIEAGAEGARQEGTQGTTVPAEVELLQADLRRLNQELAEAQREEPLVQHCVDAQTVAEVVSGWTGIPVGKVVKDEIKTLLSLKDLLAERVVGQSHALEAISQRIHTAKAKLEDPRRPAGVFLLVGPSGVGKTETAISLADTLYGGERNMVTINMSEYQESHTVSGLKGSPPGYVGYGEGGVLTEAVRRKPYCVVLLDEMEKAHTDVMELFYQVFDKGTLEDGEGRVVDFKNTIILMTSNAGTDTVMKLCADPETRPEPDALVEGLRADLLRVFKPAFLGRAIIVPYYPITDEVMRRIVELQLGRIRSRLRENNGAEFSYDDGLISAIAGRCTEVESGARNVDHILTRTLLPDISREFLGRMAAGQAVSRVHVGLGESGRFAYQVT